MKPFNKNNLNTPWVAYTIATCSAVVLFSILTHLDVIGRALHGMGAFLYPIVLAAIIAYILNPLVDFYKKSLFENVPSERLRGNLSVFCAILSFLLVALILLVSLIPQVISGIVQFVGNFDSYASSMQRLLGRLNDYALEMNLDISGLINSSGSLLDTLSSLLPRSLNNIVNTSINLTKSIFEAVVSFILAVYFLSAKDNLKAGFKFLLESVLSPSVYPGTIDFLKNCHNIMLRYIIFDALDGIIIGVSNGLFMAAAGMPYVVLVSVLVGVTNLAPTFGPFVGGIVGALILFLVNPWYALWFLLFTLILQTIDGYILKPKLFGDSLGVPAVWVLVSIIFFGRLFGILGVIISIPLAAIVNYIYQTRIVNRLRKRRENNELQRSILKAKESERDKSMKA